MRRHLPKIILFLAVIAIAGFALEWAPLLTLENLKSHIVAGRLWEQNHPVLTATGFLLIFAVIDGIGLPLDALFSIAAGAVFPLPLAVALSVLARSLGDAAAFILVRRWLRKLFEQRYPLLQERIEQGIKQNGLFYLFLLRLIPGLPPPLVNAGMGLSGMPLKAFVTVNTVALFPWTIAYVVAGKEISALHSLSQIVRPRTIMILVVIAGSVFLLKQIRRRFF